MWRRLIIAIAVALLSVQISGATLASNLPANSGGLLDDLNNNNKRQEELKKQIKDTQNQQKTLASQIIYMESQIELTGLQIDETNSRLTTLAQNIVDTIEKLNTAEQKFDHMVYVKDTRVRKIYKESYIGPLEVILSSENVNDLLIKQKYSDAVHRSDVNLMTQLRETRDNIETEKQELEKKKVEEENLKSSLVGKQNSLANQKAQRAYLLEVTKNDEATYQAMLAQAKSEQASILAALGGGGVIIGPVTKGQLISFQGNTGCTTGTHLHFEYRINGGAVDPAGYINNGTLGRPESLPAPYFPTLGQYNSNPSYWYSVGITQPFGANPNSFNYGSQGHPAIDMTAGYKAPIYAAKAGTARLIVDNNSYGCPSAYWHPPAKGIVIDHPDGTKTLYWHIQ